MTDFNEFDKQKTQEKVDEVVDKAEQAVNDAQPQQPQQPQQPNYQSQYYSQPQQPGYQTPPPPPYQQPGYNPYQQPQQQPVNPNYFVPRPVPVGYPQKSRILAGVFGIIFGGIGLHNFYLGYTTRAVIQIVVSILTCGVGSIWGMIEGIMLIAGCYNNNCDANGIPLKEI